jgi:heat shock protein HslJ
MPRRRSSTILVSSLFALLLPGSVTIAQSPAAAPGSGPALEGTAWAVTAVAGVADPSAVAGMNADLVLSDGHAGGFGGCNQFSTTYLLDGDSLTFTVPASTSMACDEAKMSFESVYLGALPQTASYAIDGTTLRLIDAQGQAVVTLSAPTGSSAGGASALVGTWTVTGINNGAQAVVSVPAEPVLPVAFLADGTVQGFGGCNSFGGPYVAGQDTIGIGPLQSTLLTCGDATDATEQQLVAALQAATAWSLRGTTLELRDDSGAIQVGLTAGVPAPTAS